LGRFCQILQINAMQDALIKGILLGLTLAALIGPVFFALIQTSIHRGFKAGFFLAIGISLSDSLYIFLTNFFLSFVQSIHNLNEILGVFGGFVLIIVGVMTMLKSPGPPRDIDMEIERSRLKSLALIGRGFLLNFAHPGVLIFWLGIITLINSNWQYDTDAKITLYLATVITVFSTDLLKAFLAGKISHLLTPRFLLWMNRIMGVILIIFGLQLFLRTLFF